MNQHLFGILNLNKPARCTSRQVVNSVQHVVWPARVGHAGTLDPLATGVLVLCVGRATRLIEQIQSRPKQYRATFLLGRRSETDDVTGAVTVVSDRPAIPLQAIEAALPEFTGSIEQVPPQFSAVHVEGQRAYKRARNGEKLALSPRTVEVYEISLVSYDSPAVTIDVCCGSGTYIRSIGRDLGERLGCGAVLSELLRTRIGPYMIEQATHPDRVTAETVTDLLLPATTAVAHLRQYRCPPDTLEDIRCGRPFSAPPELSVEEGETIAIVAPDGRLASLAGYNQCDGKLKAKPVFLDP